MTALLRGFLREQAAQCAALGSPFNALLLTLLAERLTPDSAVGHRVLTWQGEPGSRDDALALRLAAGFHALVLSGRDAGLAALYPPASPDPARLWPAVEQAMERHADLLLAWLDSPPQTNEVRRSAPLIAAVNWLTSAFGLPVVLSELGSSAGLNLLWDHYALIVGDRRYGPRPAALELAPDWQGPLPPLAAPRIINRAGVDLNPLDPEADRLRLMSYIWPDQADRLARTDAALRLAARLRPPVARGDAAGWLAQRLARPIPGALHIVFHTIAWQYFPDTTRQGVLDALDEAGARATLQAPLAHLTLEADQGRRGARLQLMLWPGAAGFELGRADFHGRWVDWQDPVGLRG